MSTSPEREPRTAYDDYQTVLCSCGTSIHDYPGSREDHEAERHSSFQPASYTVPKAMSTSPERATVHDRRPDELADLYKRTKRAVAANLVAGGLNPRRMASTRAAIAQTLRWAAEQVDNPQASWLSRWAEQVEQLVPCSCGLVYDPDDADEHFATVAHDWDQIPRAMRGLPEGGDRDAAVV